jgi:hypothetical protein
MNNQWRLISQWGSLRDGDPADDAAAFHAGHLNDVLRLNAPPDNPLLVASATSGVWQPNESGGIAMPLSSSWPQLVLNCLAEGFYSPLHVYAAGDALWETDTTLPDPLFNWRMIPVQLDGEHPLKTGIIWRVIVVRQKGVLVLACDQGVFWAQIPPAGGIYAFKKATSLPGLRYSGLAEGTGGTVLAGAWGTDQVSHFGIFLGEWTPGAGVGDLVFKTVNYGPGIDPKKMLRIEIAACASDRDHLYAVCGGGGDLKPVLKDGKPDLDDFKDIKWAEEDFILVVMKSNNGGKDWNVTGSTVKSHNEPLFGDTNQDLAGSTQRGYNLCIGVSPLDPQRVAVGLGAFFFSEDGGTEWRLFTDDNPHLHTDVHSVYFDPTDPTKQTVYIGSDGGLARTGDWGQTFSSSSNRQLPNFQVRRFAASFQNSGLIGGSLQDNGNVYTPLYIAADPWKDLDGGDGRLMMFLRSGHLARHNNGLQGKNSAGVYVEFGNEPRAAEWDDAKRQFHDLQLFTDPPYSRGVIPLDGSADGLANTSEAREGDQDDNIIEVVNVPTGENDQSELMVAVAAETEAVFGLFEGSESHFHWQPLPTVLPHLPDKDADGNDKDYFATASASLDGNSIFVGMNNGKTFRLDAPTWEPGALKGIDAGVHQFLVLDGGVAFAVAGQKIYNLDGDTWKALPTGGPGELPGGAFYKAIEADRTTAPPTLFVATAAMVWSSADNGKTWSAMMAGLPVLPQCENVRFVTESSQANFLYLSTFGWSVFKRLLNAEDNVTQTVNIKGLMDIVDRVAVGEDIWAHPKFAITFTVGPFHPIDEQVRTEDDGDEIQVALKIRVEWQLDGSVVVKFAADLISKDEDNEVDDHREGSLTVASGLTQPQVIDLVTETADLFQSPDRAHIEFQVENV